MTLVCHDADHHQDATMLTKNQNKDSCYNRLKIVGVSSFAANLAKRLSPRGDPWGNAGLSFLLQYALYLGHILSP